MSTKWAHLPNAHLIDWVLKSLKTDPNAWKAAEALDASRYAAWEAWEEALDAAWDAAWVAAREAASEAEVEMTAGSWDAILALIVDDNAAQYLHMESDKLKVWAILSEKPAAVLLIPANKIWQQEHAENALQYD